MPNRRLTVVSLFAFVAAGCTVAPVAEAPAVPMEEPWRLEGRAMAAAADPRAVEAALEVMREGGSAVDAAIAAHTVLGLVEPQSSGLGGGGYMLVYNHETGETTVYDGRETAPADAGSDLFIQDGAVMDFVTAVRSGRSVGAPGAVALYKAAHDALGKLPWDKDFEAAIKLADEGFIVSPRLQGLLTNRYITAGPLPKGAETGPYFYPNGEALKVGDRRDNPDYANTLRRIAAEGPAAFYSGEIAQGIVDAVHADPIPGGLTLDDLANYSPRTVEAVCGPFHAYTVCSAPPSSSGGVAMNLIMGLYQRFTDAETDADPDTLPTRRLADWVKAQQLAYADRDHYVGDPDFVSVPVADLLNPAYLDARAAAGITPGDTPQAGDPGEVLRGEPIIDMWGRDLSEPQPGTTHMSFVDFEGNAVSFTATIEGPFGSGRWTHGFLLNNQLTDFSRDPELNGKPVANAPTGDKRPRSSMSPTLVFDADGDFFMATGSPGGNSIIAYVSKTLTAVLDWGVDAQAAAALPNVIARGKTVRVESTDETGATWAAALRDAGFDVKEVQGEISGIHIIVARDDHYEGGADPRREGVATEIIRSPLPADTAPQ